MDIEDLQKLWDDSGIVLEFVKQGDHGFSAKSIVEQMDDGIFLSHYDGGDFVDADKLGLTIEAAEDKLQAIIAEYTSE